MTINRPALEALGDHDYLVRFQQDDDIVIVRMHADLPWSCKSPTTSNASSKRPRPT